jgi:uncharacterized protein (UPF0276 family)
MPAEAGLNPAPALPGIGLRHAHLAPLMAMRPAVGWLEVHSENFLAEDAARHALEILRHDYPISLHGVGLSLGSAGPLDRAHLRRIATLAARLQPCRVSEHVSWSRAGAVHFNDLLPLPYTSESLDLFCAHVDEMQDMLGRTILVENPASYLSFAHSTIPECEFIGEIARRTGCGLLLDVNNLHIGACNNGLDASAYLAALPAPAVGEIHLAGHTAKRIGTAELLIDDHGGPVADPVWALYREALALVGPCPTIVEWDTRLPALEVLLAEAAKARTVLADIEAPTAGRAELADDVAA